MTKYKLEIQHEYKFRNIGTNSIQKWNIKGNNKKVDPKFGNFIE